MHLIIYTQLWNSYENNADKIKANLLVNDNDIDGRECLSPDIVEDGEAKNCTKSDNDTYTKRE